MGLAVRDALQPAPIPRTTYKCVTTIDLAMTLAKLARLHKNYRRNAQAMHKHTGCRKPVLWLRATICVWLNTDGS